MRHTAPTASPEYRRLATLPVRELEAIMVRGQTPDLDALVGWEYRGYNPKGLVYLVGVRKFKKGFYRDEHGRVYGYNVVIKQNGIGAPWKTVGRKDRSIRHGFFLVSPVDPTSRDNAYLHALLLDYGRGKNPPVDPTNVTRDYLVRVEPGSDDLLLGKAYAALGPARVPVGFFLLERDRASEFRR